MSRDEPGPWVRGAVVLVLRVGLGMILLTSGLINCIVAQQIGGTPMRMTDYVTIQQYGGLGVLPYFETALGLALILGFFTATATIAAIAFYTLTTLVHIFMLFMASEPSSLEGLQNSLRSVTAPNVMLCAAVLWFSPIATNPWSLDRLMFPRRDNPIEPPAPQPPAIEPSPAPPPGERVARFVAGTGDSSADKRR